MDTTREAIIKAVAETVKECGEAPEGVMYAALLERLPDITPQAWTAIVETVIARYPITRQNYLLKWAQK